jgi:uncharacterized membrane-anchored protein
MIDFKELKKLAETNKKNNIDINLNIISENISKINLIIKENLLLEIETHFKNQADFGRFDFYYNIDINHIIDLFKRHSIIIFNWSSDAVKVKIYEILKNNFEDENIIVLGYTDGASAIRVKVYIPEE